MIITPKNNKCLGTSRYCILGTVQSWVYFRGSVVCSSAQTRGPWPKIKKVGVAEPLLT